MTGGTMITLTINGAEHSIDADPGTTLLDVLREKLSMTGAKKGCNQGVCGACTVLLDGKTARACLSLALNCTGREITTIEGISDNGEASVLQQSFVDNGAVQCGFCTSGMIVTSHALLKCNPNPSVEEVQEGLSGNLCRCSGYRKIIDAVRSAAEG